MRPFLHDEVVAVGREEAEVLGGHRAEDESFGVFDVLNCSKLVMTHLYQSVCNSFGVFCENIVFITTHNKHKSDIEIPAVPCNRVRGFCRRIHKSHLSVLRNKNSDDAT